MQYGKYRRRQHCSEDITTLAARQTTAAIDTSKSRLNSIKRWGYRSLQNVSFKPDLSFHCSTWSMFLSTPDAFAWVELMMSASAGRWKNCIIVESIEHSLYYEPIPSQEAIFSIPLCLIVGEKDFLAAPDLAAAVHAQAMEPKSLTVLKGGHFNGFPGKGFEIASTTAVKCFEKYLRQIETPVLQFAVA